MRHDEAALLRLAMDKREDRKPMNAEEGQA
jgi:hypothetical protein